MVIREFFEKIGAGIQRNRNSRLLKKEKDAEIGAMIENVVDAIDPIIRSLRGYRKNLRPGVEHALQYTDSLVQRIPGPIEVCMEKWDADPYLNALFVTADQVRAVSTLSPKLQAFSRKHHLTTCYALLTATKLEKTIFVKSRQGETIMTDIPRTSVTFTDHRILAPSPTLADTQDRLKERALNVLSSQVLEDILEIESKRQELEEIRDGLEAKLRYAHEHEHGWGHLFGEAPADEDVIQETRDLLATIGEELESAGTQLRTREDHLELVRKALYHPADYLKLETITFKLNKMGIKLSKNSQEPGNEITLAELSTKRTDSRVGILVQLKIGSHKTL